MCPFYILSTRRHDFVYRKLFERTFDVSMDDTGLMDSGQAYRQFPSNWNEIFFLDLVVCGLHL